MRTDEEFNVPFSLGDPAEVRSLLEDAGFLDVEVSQETREARFADADRFVENVEYAYSAVLPEFAEDPARFRQFVRAVESETREAIESYRDGDAIVFPLAANIATARRSTLDAIPALALNASARIPHRRAWIPARTAAWASAHAHLF